MCKGHRTLDFGCGRGDLLAMLEDGEGMDLSEQAVKVCTERGLVASVGSIPVGHWGTIVATELLEHLDDDKAMLETFFEHTDRVIYAVPHNCLPPGLEPEHRRVYTQEYVRQITPYFKTSWNYYDYLVVLAERDGVS